MIILRFYKIIYTLFFTLFFINKISGQNQNIEVSQNSKLEQLLSEKRKINTTIAINECYKIQIFNGNNETAKKTVSEFKQEFKAIDATIVFNTPNYKVWVGNFKTRIEVERNLIEIKKKYTNALLIKPSK
jgi:hypothetical protein